MSRFVNVWQVQRVAWFLPPLPLPLPLGHIIGGSVRSQAQGMSMTLEGPPIPAAGPAAAMRSPSAASNSPPNNPVQNVNPCWF
jgi:hypothetical protein